MKTKKLNRGLIITAAVVLIVVVYLVIIESYRSSEMPIIEDFIGKFEKQYATAEETASGTLFTEDELQENNDLLAAYFASESNYKTIINQMEQSLLSSDEISNVIRNVKRLNDFTYSDGCVGFTATVDISFMTSEGIQNTMVNDVFKLRKNEDNGNYEVVFASFGGLNEVNDKYMEG